MFLYTSRTSESVTLSDNVKTSSSLRAPESTHYYVHNNISLQAGSTSKFGRSSAQKEQAFLLAASFVCGAYVPVI